MKAKINIIIISFLCLALALPLTLAAWAEAAPLTKEQELGLRFHLKISTAEVLLEDPTVNDYYRSIGNRIIEGAGLEPEQYHFYIANHPTVNVFTVPGGYSYMCSETIINLENEGQLASLLAHEVAHLSSRHYARLMEAASSMGMGYLSSMLAGVFLANPFASTNFSGCVMPTYNSESSFLNILSNSREDENEADDKGRGYLTKAGYNPQDMYDAVRIIAKKTYPFHRNIPTYLTTHSALTNRLATTFKEFEGSPPSPPDLKYLAFRDRVQALSDEPRRVQSVMAKRLKSDQNDHSAIHALGILAARQQKLSDADKLMNRALSLDPDNQDYLADLGDLALRRSQPAEAKKYFEKAGMDNRQAVLGLARASELLGETSQAAALYDQAVNMETTAYSAALESAGRFFGLNGQEAKSHYYLARYFASKGNLKEAIFHYRETAKHPDAEPYQASAKREIDILTKLKDNR